MSLSLGARVYIWLVVAAAAAMLAYWQRVWQRPIVPDTHTLGLMFTLVGLAILTMHFPLAVTPRYKVTLSLAIYFACLLLFGPPAAMVLVGGAQLLGGATLIARRNPATGQRMRTVRSALFNTGQYMLATGFAGLVYYAFLPHLAPAPLERVENLWALPLAGTVMYLANTVAVAVIV